MHLNEHLIPSFGSITTQTNPRDGKYALNAYLLDFYTHGQVAALATANGIRRGDVWYALQEFDLTLMTVRGVLEQLLQRRSASTKAAMLNEDVVEDVDSEYTPVMWEDEEDTEKQEENATHDLKRPNGVSNADWRMFEVVNGALEEFNEKYKAMWA
jgi:hypothetical protein